MDHSTESAQSETIREFLGKGLVTNGLWPDEAKTIVDIVQTTVSDMEHRMDDSLDSYPPAFQRVILITAQQCAKEWLEEHHPKHFALAILDGRLADVARETKGANDYR